MEKMRKKKQIIRSMMEFEKEFLPKSFEKRISHEPTDPRALGISLAKESLDKVRAQLSK